jgi:tetratricopeptide (TPR) repeat protein
MNKGRLFYVLPFLGLILLLESKVFAVSIESSSATASGYIVAGDSLAAKDTEEGLGAAIKEYEKALQEDPENFDALWKISDAYNSLIEIKTGALIVEKDEYKPILYELGARSVAYAKRAYKINPKSREAVKAYLGGYGYYSSSIGIVSAILKGAAGLYKDLANQLIAIDERYEGGYGYRSLGRFYYVAPFPLKSRTKSRAYYEKAIEIEPAMLEPRYWLGLINFDERKYELARTEFEFVVNQPPHRTEASIISEYKKQAQIQLDKIPAITGPEK